MDFPTHPGQYVRDKILSQKKLSVTAAAKLVGVGRPALSNFLNGHVSTTPEMASRIEVAFGVPSQKLLDMQAACDAAQAKTKAAPSNATPYVVPFLGIKAAEIEAGVGRLVLGIAGFEQRGVMKADAIEMAQQGAGEAGDIRRAHESREGGQRVSLLR